jgi:hypothetical protein
MSRHGAGGLEKHRLAPENLRHSALERYTLPMKLIRTLFVTALAGLCFTATAQWQWIDKDGHKVFSDRAPPPEILDKNIVKRPVGRIPAKAAAETEAGVDATTPTPALPAVPISGAKAAGIDKDLEAKKKQALDEEAAKRKVAEQEVTKSKIENCARAKQAKVTFESGMRVARPNAAGEREFMDEATRADELKRIQAIIAKDCK